MAEKQYIRSLSTKILIAFGTMSVGLTLFSLFATLITTDGERRDRKSTRLNSSH